MFFSPKTHGQKLSFICWYEKKLNFANAGSTDIPSIEQLCFQLSPLCFIHVCFIAIHCSIVYSLCPEHTQEWRTEDIRAYLLMLIKMQILSFSAICLLIYRTWCRILVCMISTGSQFYQNAICVLRIYIKCVVYCHMLVVPKLFEDLDNNYLLNIVHKRVHNINTCLLYMYNNIHVLDIRRIVICHKFPPWTFTHKLKANRLKVTP